MSTSYDDPASRQSYYADQHTGASSANPQSPPTLVVSSGSNRRSANRRSPKCRASSTAAGPTTAAAANLPPHLQQQSSNAAAAAAANAAATATRSGQIQQQQPVAAHQQPPHPYYHQSHESFAAYANEYYQAYHQHQQQHNFPIPCPVKSAHTGVEKLILAAMVEDPATYRLSVAAVNNQQLPSGRGIGYMTTTASTNNSNHNQLDSYADTPTPRNKSELELYSLLQRANLLSYFGTFLNFGGDDVQQFCDADEEEFLEIMNLVGMTHKPLHVRRFQKALLDWRETREQEMSHHHQTMYSHQAIHRQHRSRQPLFRRTSSPVRFTSIQAIETSRHNFASSDVLAPTPESSPIHQIHHLVDPSSNSNKRASEEHQHSLDETESQDNDDDDMEQEQAQSPHEVLIGAPKRLRLMDDLHRKNASQQSSPSCYYKYTGRAASVHSDQGDMDQMTETSDISVTRSISSPKSQGSIRDDGLGA